MTTSYFCPHSKHKIKEPFIEHTENFLTEGCLCSNRRNLALWKNFLKKGAMQ